MTPEQTAQQLELAAQILRTGHPFEVRHDASDRWHASLGVNPAQAVLQDWHIRPVLITPPDNRPLHNPDNLTAEQVGMGYRLTIEGEPPHEDAKVWLSYYGEWCDRNTTGPYVKHHAYRLPLSVPWPALPDPYAELKAAHAAGKVIQLFDSGSWHDLPDPAWGEPVDQYRIKPEPAFQLPPPPPGMRWHREDEKKTVPFDISDVPPCSVLSLHPPRWFDIYGVCKEGIYVLDDEPLVETLWKWNYLAEKVKINRSIPLTGKWDPNSWEPCHKTISQNG